MPNMQYPSYPMTNWSSEISAPQPAVHAHSTTSTTTTTTASASSGVHGIPAPAATAASGMAVPAPGTQAAQQPQSDPAAAGASAAAEAPAASGSPAADMPSAAGGVPVASGAPAASGSPAGRNEFEGSVGTLDLETHQPIELIEAPTNMNEAFLGSLKAMLLRNRGNFVTATFLIGTQGTTAWEGILHDVGNDYVIIFQPGRQRYIACDIYSLKYIEFYDTRQREMCERMLRQSGMDAYF